MINVSEWFFWSEQTASAWYPRKFYARLAIKGDTMNEEMIAKLSDDEPVIPDYVADQYKRLIEELAKD